MNYARTNTLFSFFVLLFLAVPARAECPITTMTTPSTSACGQPCNGSITVTNAVPGVIYSLVSSAVDVDVTSPTGVFTGLCPAEDYAVNASAPGCTPVIVPVGGTGSPQAVIAQTSVTRCAGDLLFLNCDPASASATYIWTLPDESTVNTGNTASYSKPEAQVSDSGPYTVTVTYNGCTTTSIPTPVTILPVPVAGITPAAQTIGVESTLQFTATPSGAASYSLVTPARGTINQTSPDFTFPNVTTSDAGAYMLTVSAANGCSGTATATVTVSPTACTFTVIPACGTNNGTVIYDGPSETLALTVDGVRVGVPMTGSHLVFTGIIPFGNYILGTVGTGPCTTAGEMPLASGNPTNVSVTPVNPSCGNCDGSITITATSVTNPVGGPIYYQIQKGTNAPLYNNTGVFTNLCAGTYTVTVEAGVGCQVVSTTTLSAPTIAASLTPTTQTVTLGSTITLTAAPATGIATYSLVTPARGTITQTSPVFTLPKATSADAGAYLLTVTATNGCLGTASATVAVGAPLMVSAVTIPFDPVNNIPGSITATVTGGTGPYTVKLLPTGTTIKGAPGQTVFTFGQLPPGTYTVVATDSTGATVTLPSVVVGSQRGQSTNPITNFITNVLCQKSSTTPA